MHSTYHMGITWLSVDPHHIQHMSLRSSSASWGLGRKHSLCFHCSGSRDIRDTAWSTHSEQHWMLKERKSRVCWNPKPFVTGMCYKRSPFLAPFNRRFCEHHRCCWASLAGVKTLMSFRALFFGWEWDSQHVPLPVIWLASHSTVQYLQLKLCKRAMWHPHVSRTADTISSQCKTNSSCTEIIDRGK